MKSWNETKLEAALPKIEMFGGFPEYLIREYLYDINQNYIEEPYKGTFLSIRKQYNEGKSLSSRQIKFLQTCWDIAENNEYAMADK
jgi:hypothetical protein